MRAVARILLCLALVPRDSWRVEPAAMERASLDGGCAFRGHFAQPHDASFEMPERFQLLTSRCSSEMQLAAGIVSQRASYDAKRHA